MVVNVPASSVPPFHRSTVLPALLDPTRIVLFVLAGVLVVGTVLPFVRTPYWWVRMFDFPRVQIASLAALVLIGLAATAGARGRLEAFDAAALGLLGVALAYQVVRIARYSPVWRVQTADAHDADGKRSIRLVVSNVQMPNRDGVRWLSVVRSVNPDVVAAVETDEWWARTTGLLKQTHPHAVQIPQDDTYGMCLYSRFPLAEVEVRHLVEKEVPSLFVTVELPSGERVRLVLLHPRPPRPDIGQDSTLRDAELVLAAHEVAGHEAPTIVAGDLNDVAWSATTTLFQKVAGVLDPRVGRGLFSTFHARYRLLRYPLDHVFHTEHLALVSLARLGDVGSDHFPMCVELALCAAADEQDEPDEDADAREHEADVLSEVRTFKREETVAEARARKAADV